MLGAAEWTSIDLLTKPFLVAIILGLAFAIAFSFQGEGRYLGKLRQNILPSVLYSIPTALIGFIAGYLTGISRSPAVGTIVPAILTLVAGLNIYFFGADRERGNNRALVGYSVFLFSLIFFYAVWSGVIDRETGTLGRLIELSEKEKLIRAYRSNRGLPPDPPAWILGGEGK